MQFFRMQSLIMTFSYILLNFPEKCLSVCPWSYQGPMGLLLTKNWAKETKAHAEACIHIQFRQFSAIIWAAICKWCPSRIWTMQDGWGGEGEGVQYGFSSVGFLMHHQCSVVHTNCVVVNSNFRIWWVPLLELKCRTVRRRKKSYPSNKKNKKMLQKKALILLFLSI